MIVEDGSSFHEQEFLEQGTVVFTNQHHRIGTDALLLSHFCQVKASWKVCDLGSGCGIIAFSLIDQGLMGKATAVELNSQAAVLIEKGIQKNKLENQLILYNGDLRQFTSPYLFDLVVTNPPYFNNGPASLIQDRACARHENTVTLEEILEKSFKLLKDRGRLCLCFPPSRLGELIYKLQDNKLSIKRLQFIRKSPSAKPWLALVDARKHGGIGLDVLPDLILNENSPLTY